MENNATLIEELSHYYAVWQETNYRDINQHRILIFPAHRIFIRATDKYRSI